MMQKRDMLNSIELQDYPEHVTKKISMVMRKMKLTKEKSTSKRKLIDDITESNTRLEKNLEGMKSEGNCRKEVAKFNVISKLVKQMDHVENQLKTEREHLADLQGQINQIHKPFLESHTLKSNTRKKLLSNNPLDSNTIEKSKDMLQEKLHVATIQLGNEETKNNELRAKIRALMSERKAFNKEYDSLLDKLKNGKQVMEDLKSSVNKSVSLRQNIKTKLDQLNIKEKKQRKIQVEEAINLEQRKDQETRWKLFFERKLKRRTMIPLSEQRRRNRLHDDRGGIGSAKILTEFKTVKEFIGNAFGMKLEEEEKDNEAIRRRIQREYSDTASLFAYLAQLKYELEAMKEKVFNQEIEVEERMAIEEEMTDQLAKKVRHLERSKTYYAEEAIAVADELATSKRNLIKLLNGITHLTVISKTDLSPLLKLLGFNNIVTEFNYELFLKALETNIISLMKRIIPVGKRPSKDTSTWTRSMMVQEESFNRTPTTVVLNKIAVTIPCPICYPPAKKIQFIDMNVK